MKRFQRGVLVVGMLTFLAGAQAWAQEQEEAGAKAGEKSAMQGQQQEEAAQEQWTHKATDILGKTVMSKQGEKLGEIENFAIEEGGRIKYVILSSGGLLGIGEEKHTIPWSAFRAGEEENTLVANVTEQDIEKYTEAQDYRRVAGTSAATQPEEQAKEKEKTEEMAEEQKAADQQAQKEMKKKDHQSAGKAEETKAQMVAVAVEKAKDWMGKKVVGKDQQDLGTIANLFISQQGDVTYVIVEDGSNRMHPVPIDMVRRSKDKDRLQAAFDRKAFEQSPAFAAGDLPMLAGEVEQQIRGYYDKTGQKTGPESKQSEQKEGTKKQQEEQQKKQ